MPLTTEAARVVWEFATPGNVSTAITTLDLDSAITADPNTVVAALRSAYTGHMLLNTTDEWILGNCTLYMPSGGGSIPYVATGSTAGPTGTPMSAAVSLLVTKQTAQGGRRGKGRMFLPPPNQSNVNGDGIVASGFLTTMQTRCDSFLAAIKAIDPSVQPVVHTRSVGGLPSGNTLITKLVAAGEVATQRRRQRR